MTTETPMVERIWASGVRASGGEIGYPWGTSKDGPGRGVGTSGRGLADASKGVD